MTAVTVPTAAAAAPDALMGRMPLAEHLREATRRGIRIVIAFSIAAVAGWLLSDAVMDVLRGPIEQLAASRDASLNYDSVTGAFDLKLRVTLATAVVLSSPVWLFEIFAFVAPGLTRRERKHVFGFAGAAIVLFAGGCAAGFALFPHMVELLAGFASDQDSTILQASYYVDFVLKIVLAMGVAAVLPVLLVLLNVLGVLPARTIARTWRASVVGIVVFSAVVTPAADVLSMFLVAVPMAGLFALALIAAVVHDRAAARRVAGERAGAPMDVISCSG